MSLLAPTAGPTPAPAGPERLVVPALCQPSLLGELPSADPIAHLLGKHIPPHLRPIRDASGAFPPNESPQDPDLASAMRSNAWRRIAVFAKDRIISAGAPPPTPSSAPGPSSSEEEDRIEPAGPHDVSTVLRWWNVRLQALLRLRMYAQFRLELESLWAILKRTTIPRHAPPSTIPTSLPAQPSTGTNAASGDALVQPPAYLKPNVRYVRLLDSPIVPFSLHVLRAKEPMLAGDPRAALEKCHALLQRCRVMQRRFLRVASVDGQEAGDAQLEEGARAEASMWQERGRRMTLAIAFILVDLEDYASAISLLRPLISLRPTTPEAQVLNLLVARLLLEAGAVESAQACTQAVAASIDQVEASADSASNGTLRQLLDTAQALLSVWQGDYAAAETRWKAHLPGLYAEPSPDEPANTEMNPATMSNLALARFYQGHVEEATSILERLLQEEPSTASSAEAVIFNLITMHELRSDDSISHKRRILVHVAQWAGDGGGTSCLKLT
ncbi:hypothetical protein OC846_000579 [Tilletia horrida]|uniref:TPR-like protein n=1 Tax=Tilletia horrida TaxID=155126 RepID=A0AAN6JUG7_9BASI|nr:hypothetical protein OC846_000579 [Tilletia horrida]KAK0569666.1 hypothetical protein OC861_000748 [Tilletia horrida]